MTPEQVRDRVRTTYMRAMQDLHVERQQSSGLQHMLQNLKLYGRAAGTDFVETHAEAIVQEAVSDAECKRNSLSIPAYGCGRAAIEDIAQALRDLTALKVNVSASNVTLSWGEADPHPN